MDYAIRAARVSVIPALLALIALSAPFDREHDGLRARLSSSQRFETMVQQCMVRGEVLYNNLNSITVVGP